MNRTIFVTLLAAFLASGALATVMGYRVLAGLQRNSTAGSASEPDPEYQRMPADGATDWMTGFTLVERSGREVQWKDFKGKIRVTNFFFSSCPATCLQQNKKMQEIQQSYAGKDVVFLSITCDPDNDDPERLREYAEALKADHRQWLFLTGRLSYIKRVANELFSVPMDRQFHSERLLVSDKWGNLRGAFEWNDLAKVTQLRMLVDKLLAETEPPADVGHNSGRPE
jgi:cytochrome oxidase Cu insertion factor (SCO1/SenC/PrrC family)